MDCFGLFKKSPRNDGGWRFYFDFWIASMRVVNLAMTENKRARFCEFCEILHFARKTQNLHIFLKPFGDFATNRIF
ncbi:hypothetical protein [Helicobacter sp. 23-1045]